MKPRKIIIVGGGTVGLSVAVCLRAQLPRDLVVIQLIEDSRADKTPVESSNSRIHRFHNLIGLQEKACMFDPHTQFGLGAIYENWSYEAQKTILTEEPYGTPFSGVDFQHLYVKNRATDIQDSFENYSLSAVAAKLGRFGHPSQDEKSIYSSIKYGLHLQLESYSRILKDHALSLGVDIVQANCVEVQRDEQNNIVSLLLSNGQAVSADLFFDCSGETSVLLRDFLGVPCKQDDLDFIFDKVAIANRPKADMLPSLAALTVSDYGVFKIIPLKDQDAVTYYFSSDNIDQKNLHELLAKAGFQNIEIADYRAYRAENFWVNNCIAIGNSGVQYPDLLISPLYSVRNAVVRFLDLLIDFDEIEASRDEYNRLTHMELDDVKENVELNLYVGKDRSTVLMKFFSANKLSFRAEHRSSLFKEHGRHPSSDSSFLTDAEWAAFFLNNKIFPASYNYDVNLLSDESIQNFMHRLKNAIFDFAIKIPKYADYTAGLLNK